MSQGLTLENMEGSFNTVRIFLFDNKRIENKAKHLHVSYYPNNKLEILQVVFSIIVTSDFCTRAESLPFFSRLQASKMSIDDMIDHCSYTYNLSSYEN